MESSSDWQVDRLRIAAQQLGDRRSLLVLSACLRGVTRFEEVQRTLGIARNVLSQRPAAWSDRVRLAPRRPLQTHQDRRAGGCR